MFVVAGFIVTIWVWFSLKYTTQKIKLQEKSKTFRTHIENKKKTHRKTIFFLFPVLFSLILNCKHHESHSSTTILREPRIAASKFSAQLASCTVVHTTDTQRTQNNTEMFKVDRAATK